MSRGRNSSGLGGLLVIDKDPDWTSHDVVAKLRGMFRERRIGHAGTLDPAATGLLLVGIGPATRLLRYLQGSFKTYEGAIRFGSTTDSLDAEGLVTGEFAMHDLSKVRIEEAVSSMIGESLQIPPMFSALKIDGKRLHALARAGIEVEREARPITIEDFSIEATPDPMLWNFEVRCSSGTYVRSIADDLGRMLGGGAHLATLRRTRNDRFSLGEARTLDDIENALREGVDAQSLLLDMAVMVGSLAAIFVSDDEVARVRNGVALESNEDGEEGAYVRVLDSRGTLLAVYKRSGRSLKADAVIPQAASV